MAECSEEVSTTTTRQTQKRSGYPVCVMSLIFDVIKLSYLHFAGEVVAVFYEGQGLTLG